MLPSATAQPYQLKSKWKTDLGDMADEDWDEVLASCKMVSPKLLDRLMHLYRSSTGPTSHQFASPNTNQVEALPAPNVETHGGTL